MKKKRNLLRLLFVPLITFIVIFIPMGALTLAGYISVEKIRMFAMKMMPLILFASTMAVFCYHFTVIWLNKKLPWRTHFILRGLTDLVVVLIVTASVMTFVHGILGDYTPYRSLLKLRNIKPPIEAAFALPLSENILFMITMELLAVVDERNTLELNLERLEKAQLQTKYSALKNQLDNHFLFNNLSVLSSLIYEDVEKSDRFIQEFAKVYRYVLSITQEMLVPVERELDFIEAYLFLLKIRFEEGFQVKNELYENIYDKQLPPLALQVLIENAIKHNCLSKRHPLKIHIYLEGENIVVSNNFQPREKPDISSTHTGLKNLTEKYKLISDKAPQFGVQGEQFVVTLPLIEAKDV